MGPESPSILLRGMLPDGGAPPRQRSIALGLLLLSNVGFAGWNLVSQSIAGEIAPQFTLFTKLACQLARSIRML